MYRDEMYYRLATKTMVEHLSTLLHLIVQKNVVEPNLVRSESDLLYS